MFMENAETGYIENRYIVAECYYTKVISAKKFKLLIHDNIYDGEPGES